MSTKQAAFEYVHTPRCVTHFEIAKLKLILRKRHVSLTCPILKISFNLVAVELASGLVNYPL